METNKVRVLQKLLTKNKDNYLLAEKYYSLLAVINSLHLTERDIQLIAFTAIKGNISYNNFKEEFCQKHNSTGPTVYNIISKLKKIGIFVKDKGKIKVNPIILLDFNKEVTLEIDFVHG